MNTLAFIKTHGAQTPVTLIQGNSRARRNVTVRGLARMVDDANRLGNDIDLDGDTVTLPAWPMDTVYKIG
ncbi:hypothetical protein SEA_DALANDE_99 [Gordonia phage DalanDe]|nr:hypothetical protein SEA_DALANDE_99 [Gordonia phage DalanDe]